MGEMQPQSDAQLLRNYAEHGSEPAFTELVQRHTNLVYSAALRQVETPDIAAEITQSVFVALARGAKSLSPRLTPEASLAGWLCRSAGNLSRNHRRDEFRRSTRERLAMEQLLVPPDAAPDWERLSCVLDAAMAELNETDYDALVLRFFQNQDFRTVGTAIGVSDDTAQKRVARALEKLRELLAQRGIRTTAGALGIVITANAVQAAPVGLAVTISATAFAGTAAATSTVIAATTKTIAMTSLQKTLVTATVAALAGVGLYQTRQAAQLREQAQTLQQQQSLLAGHLQEMQRERDEATSQLAALRTENEGLNRDTTELLRLRGEVARLSRDSQEFAQLTAGKARTSGDSGSAEMNAVLAQVNELKKMLDQKPDLKIPELEFLTPQDWLNVAAGAKLDTDSGARVALSRLRAAGKLAFAPMLEKALTTYVQANGGQLPTEILLLKPFFNPPVDDALLDRYQLLASGQASDLPTPKQSLSSESVGGAGTDRIRFRPPTSEGSVISEKARVDGVYDSVLSVGLNGSHLNELGPPGSGLDGVTRSTILLRGSTRTHN